MDAKQELVDVVRLALVETVGEDHQARAEAIQQAIEKAFPPMLVTEVPEHRIANERDEAREVLRELVELEDEPDPWDAEVVRRNDAAVAHARAILKGVERTHVVVPLRVAEMARRALRFASRTSIIPKASARDAALADAFLAAERGEPVEWPTGE